MQSSILTEFSNAMADVSAGVLRSLVRVHMGGRGAGAGAIWHADGLIVTNAHVVSDRRRTRWRRVQSEDLHVVMPDGRELPARVLVEDHSLDLAALRVDAHDLPTMPLGDSRRLHAGEIVLALGFPWGVTGGATTGVFIGTGSTPNEADAPVRKWIAASLHLRPGHSGGPMVDAQGRLVGINTMMNGPDVGVAVPVHTAVDFLKRAFAV